MVLTNQPVYLSETLKNIEEVDGRIVLEGTAGILTTVDRNLSVSRGGFVYQGQKLFNSLPVSLRCELKIQKFRTRVKAWVKDNIDAKSGLKS